MALGLAFVTLASAIACHEERYPLDTVSEAIPIRDVAADAKPLCPGAARLEGLPPADAAGRAPREADLLRCIVQGRDVDAGDDLVGGIPFFR